MGKLGLLGFLVLAGCSGSNRATGDAGVSGAAGAKGSTGPAGMPGPKGSTGATGATGAKGAAGSLDAGVASGSASGSVTLIDGLDPSGVTVSLTNSNGTTFGMTDADGGFDITGVSTGVYSLSLQKTATLPADAGWVGADGGAAQIDFSALFPQVLALPGSDAFVISGSLLPLGSPIELFAGAQASAGDVDSWISSPSGAEVALFTQADQTHVEILSSTGSVLANVPTGAIDLYQAAFSPDDEHFAYLVLGTVYLAPTTGGAPVALPPTNAEAFQFSPDGSKLAVMEGVYPFDLQILSVSGSGSAVTVPASLNSPIFGWSPDGTQLEYVDFEGALWVVAAGGGSPVQLSATAGADPPPRFVPNAGMVAYEDAISGALMLANTSGMGAPVQVEASVQEFAVSPDGSRLVVLPETGTLESYPVASGIAAPLATNVDDFALSPDGSNVAALTDTENLGNGSVGTLRVISGGQTIQVATSAYAFAFSPEGTRVAFTLMDLAGNQTLEVVPVTGGDPIALLDYAQGFAWGRKGSLVAARTSPTTFALVQDGIYAFSSLPRGAP